MNVVLDRQKVMTAEEVRRGLGDAFEILVAGQDIVIERRICDVYRQREQ